MTEQKNIAIVTGATGAIGEAMGGLRYTTGDPSLPPSRAGISIGDSLAATHACLGAMMALHQVHLTGKGQVIDRSLVEAMFRSLDQTLPNYKMHGHVRERTGSQTPAAAPNRNFPTGGGGWVSLSCTNDKMFQRLCQAMEQPELAQDPRYALSNDRIANRDEVEGIFQLMQEEKIPRCCIYHLAYAGRGEKLQRFDLEPHETREALDFIFGRAQELHEQGIELDLLTVDNHTDNVYLYQRVLKDHPERADEVYEMLSWNGGNQSGIAIAAIDPKGNVHPDQFSWHQTFGNVKEKPFGEIWQDRSDPFLGILKERKEHLKGRCSVCKWLPICNGNLRVRAESYFDDALAPDPGCYLTDEECGIMPGTPEATVAAEFPVPVQEMLVAAEGAAS